MTTVAPHLQSPVQRRRRSVRRHLWFIVLAVAIAALGPWPQAFQLGGSGAYGLVWSAVTVLGLVLAANYVVLAPASQWVMFWMSVPLAVGIGHLVVSGPSGIPIVTTLALLPVSFIVSATAATRRPDETVALIRRMIRIMAFVLLAAITFKILLFGLDARELSSRPFGHGAAVALLILASSSRTPLVAVRSPAGLAAILAMGLSLSRTAWIMAVVGIAVLLWTSYRKDASRVVRVGMLGVVSAAAAWFGVTRVPFIAARFNRSGSAATLSSRDNIWPEVLDQIPNRPVFGHGPGRSAQFVADFTDGFNANPHNDFLRVGYDLGLLSVAALGIALYLVYARTSSVSTPWALGRSGLVFAIVFPIFLFFTNGLTYLGVSVPVFIVLGASVGLTYARRPDALA